MIRGQMKVIGEHLRLRESSPGLKSLIGDEWPIPVPRDESGNPLNSWRFQLAPWHAGLDESLNGVGDFSAPWDAPVNSPYSQSDGFIFSTVYKFHGKNTFYFGVTGSGSAFDETLVEKFSQLPANVIVLIEVRDSKTHWMQPGDYNVSDLLAYSGRIGDHLHGLLPDRLHVLFADGQVWALDPDAPIADLQPFLTITGAETHDREKLLAPHRVDGPE